MKNSIISLIAKNCDWHKTVNAEYLTICEDRINKLEEMLPGGSGIDAGTKIDYFDSSSNKVILTFGFHFLNDAGYYDGWEEYQCIITPSLSNDFNMKIKGKNRRQIKDYLYETFDYVLRTEINNIDL